MKKMLPIIIVLAVVIGGGAFYGGMMYGKSQQPAGAVRFQQGGGTGGQRGGMRNGNGGFVSGDILSQDNTSITLKLNNGGSKIVFLSDKTQIEKMVSGSLVDLGVGTTVTASGTANTDGSITAASIQVRPKSQNSAPKQ